MKKSKKINKRTARPQQTLANVKVVGIGGGGSNAISRMNRNFIRGVDFIAINTDHQDLDQCKVREKIYLKEEGRAAGFLSHALAVNFKYKEKWAGRILGFLKKSLGRIPIIKWPVLAFTMLCQGLLMLVSHRAVKIATAEPLKKAL